MLVVWILFPSFYRRFFFKLGIIFFLCISGLQVYRLLGSGWGSNSKYALLGTIRGAAQTISYEVSLILILFLPCCFKIRYSFLDFSNKFFWFFLVFPPLIFV